MKRSLLILAFVAFLPLAACTDTSVSPLAPELAQAPAEGQFSRAAANAARPGSATLLDLAVATDALSTLVTAVGVSDDTCGTNFAESLAGNRQLTVFAPTNAAFEDLIDELGADLVLSCDVLPTVLAFHVTPGRQISRAVLSRKSIRMLSGEFAAVEGTTIAGAPLNLGMVDISASNGVVHVVDGVLLPGSILAALAN